MKGQRVVRGGNNNNNNNNNKNKNQNDNVNNFNDNKVNDNDNVNEVNNNNNNNNNNTVAVEFNNNCDCGEFSRNLNKKTILFKSSSKLFKNFSKIVDFPKQFNRRHLDEMTKLNRNFENSSENSFSKSTEHYSN